MRTLHQQPMRAEPSCAVLLRHSTDSIAFPMMAVLFYLPRREHKRTHNSRLCILLYCKCRILRSVYDQVYSLRCTHGLASASNGCVSRTRIRHDPPFRPHRRAVLKRNLIRACYYSFRVSFLGVSTVRRAPMIDIVLRLQYYGIDSEDFSYPRQVLNPWTVYSTEGSRLRSSGRRAKFFRTPSIMVSIVRTYRTRVKYQTRGLHSIQHSRKPLALVRAPR